MLLWCLLSGSARLQNTQKHKHGHQMTLNVLLKQEICYNTKDNNHRMLGTVVDRTNT